MPWQFQSLFLYKKSVQINDYFNSYGKYSIVEKLICPQKGFRTQLYHKTEKFWKNCYQIHLSFAHTPCPLTLSFFYSVADANPLFSNHISWWKLDWFFRPLRISVQLGKNILASECTKFRRKRKTSSIYAHLCTGVEKVDSMLKQ